MTKFKRFLIFLIGASLLCASLALPSSAEADEPTDAYTQALIDKGFPASYAQKLTLLHYLHPTWEFEPLPITEMKEQYTWEYVLAQQTDNSKRNLINKSDNYVAYRHPTNTELYDSGWYQASVQAVSYFMDPENFLNEKDIFMFQDLKYSEAVTADIVESALLGTFMSDAILYDDVTYAAYLVEVGKQLDVDPLHLAARLRQEQGTSGNSPLIKGQCGDKLWYYYENQIQTEDNKQILAPDSGHTQESLLAYNGLYNYFNIGAAGTGYFAIYLGAMKEAQKGTEEMAEAWGGSGAWDTPAKAIYGGAYKLTHKYVGDYQNTLYLQKFNVDPRSSRNFWGQYMQNVGAALSEARTIFNSLYASDCIELPYHFLIPVYEGKPESNPDPAQGQCDNYAQSDQRIEYESKLIAPVSCDAVMSDMLYTRPLQMVEGEPITIKLCAFATLDFDAFFVSVNHAPATSAKSEHVSSFQPDHIDKNAPDQSPNLTSFDCSALTPGDYTIAIYGRLESPGKACPHYLLAIIKMHVESAPETTTQATTQVKPTTQPETEPPTQAPTATKADTTPAPEPPSPTEPGSDSAGCKSVIGRAGALCCLALCAMIWKKKK